MIVSESHIASLCQSFSQSFITRAVLSNTMTDENQCPVYRQKYIVLQCFFCFRLVPNGSGLQVDDEAQIHDISHLSVYLISTAKVRVLVNTTTFITKIFAKPSKAKNNLWLLCYFGDSISFS